MSSLRIVLLVVVSLPFAAAAGAAPAKAWGTRDELRQCMDLDDALDVRLRAVNAATAEHDRKFTANEAEEAQLADMKARLDRTDKTAISAFNQAVAAHAQHIQQANDEATASEAFAKAYVDDRAAADDHCAVSFHAADVDAVKKERRKAAAPAN